MTNYKSTLLVLHFSTLRGNLGLTLYQSTYFVRALSRDRGMEPLQSAPINVNCKEITFHSLHQYSSILVDMVECI